MSELRAGYLGLGSNLGDRRAHLRAALRALDAGGAGVGALSSLYETAPVGLYDGVQPDFLNLVAAISTRLGPEQLLALCKRVEAERGRDPEGPRHGPRPLDADVLTLGELRLDSRRLTIPHAALTERRFVLEPLLEIDPEASLPDGRSLAELLRALPPDRVERVGRLDPEPI